MSIIVIGKKQNINTTNAELLLENDEFCIHFKVSGRKAIYNVGKERFQFYSSFPIVLNKSGGFDQLDEFAKIPNLKALLPTLENELIGADITSEGEELNIIFSSVKFSRGRWYYIQAQNSLLFSDDLRELLPYSSRKANTDIIYGILKYGEMPEYYTAIKDIYTIPNASYLELNNASLRNYLQSGSIPLKDFNHYYKLKYTFEGGSIERTSDLLNSIVAQIAGSKPEIFVSGGIDSTLLNSLYSNYSTERYNAHYIYFGDQDQEIKYAQWAVKDTKADLHVWQMKSDDFVPSIEYASQLIIDPVIDNTGSVFIGAFFRNQLGGIGVPSIIDGTSADSCYGSKNYLNPIIKGKDKPAWQLLTNEYIASFLRLYHLPGYDRFIPRDSFENDQNLLELQWYLGPFGNTFFKDAKSITKRITPLYKDYYNLIDKSGINDEYAYYTIIKLALYASKQTTRKVYDIHPDTEVILPFLYRSILVDQAKYSWAQKSIDGIVKHPLKKFLEKHIEPDFIYRKKVGLNNQNLLWFDIPEVKKYHQEIFRTGRLRELLHPWACKALLKAMDRKEVHLDVKKIMLAMVSIELWVKRNEVQLS